MELVTKTAWILLALLHVMPTLVFLRPGLLETLYGVAPQGDVGVLLTHRGALFLAVTIAAVWAAFDPSARRLASLVCAISMIGFLIVYLRAGSPVALRKIAAADLVGLVPLLWVCLRAWR